MDIFSSIIHSISKLITLILFISGYSVIIYKLNGQDS